MNPAKMAEIFKILSVESRVCIIDLLKGRAMCVNAIARSLEITPAAVSQHLRILRSADIVIAEKRGYHVHYSLNSETLRDWKGMTDKMFLQ